MMKAIKIRIILTALFFLLAALLSACAAPVPAQETADPESQETVSQPAPEETVGLHCSLTIRCDTILQHMDELTRGKESLIPEDGLLFSQESVEFEEGDSVFDVLQRELTARRLHLEFSESPLYGSVYVEGIFNLYEFDCGDLSGWIYRVNGEAPGYGCSKYILSDGDRVEWLYTCDLGNDL